MRWIVLASAFFAASVAQGQQFVVVNKMPIRVVNHCPAVVRVPTVTTRAAIGHSHTCPRCGTTWDHAVTAGHNCPNCGTEQRVQDSRPRMVTVRTTATAVAAPTRTVQPQYHDVMQMIQSGGCPNGNCPNTRR